MFAFMNWEYVVAALTQIKGCPCVLSFGKLINENGFGYVWKTGTVPYLFKDDMMVYCYTHHEVPFICMLHDEGYMMNLHNAQNAGGGTSESPVTPTARSKRKAKAQKKKEVIKSVVEKDKGVIAQVDQLEKTEPPPPPIPTEEINRIVS